MRDNHEKDNRRKNDQRKNDQRKNGEFDIGYFEEIFCNREPIVSDMRGRFSVLALFLFPEGEEGQLLFEVRSETLRHQPGEICLPGGHLEMEESPRECALREASEELLIPKERIRMLGPLGYDYTYYGDLIHAYVGTTNIEDLLSGGVSAAEVKEVFTVPFSFLMERGPQEYYDYEGHHIWGLTARVLRRLVRICRGEEPPAGTDWGPSW